MIQARHFRRTCHADARRAVPWRPGTIPPACTSRVLSRETPGRVQRVLDHRGRCRKVAHEQRGRDRPPADVHGGARRHEERRGAERRWDDGSGGTVGWLSGTDSGPWNGFTTSAPMNVGDFAGATRFTQER